MKKLKMKIMFILVMMIVMAGVVWGSSTTYEGYNNFTLEFPFIGSDSGFYQFEYDGLKNISYNLTQSWINISCDSHGIYIENKTFKDFGNTTLCYFEFNISEVGSYTFIVSNEERKSYSDTVRTVENQQIQSKGGFGLPFK